MALRQNLLNQRKMLSSIKQREAAHSIAEKIYDLPLFKESQHIAFYQAIHGEVDCKPLMTQAWQCHKNVLLPVLNVQALKFVHYRLEHPLIKNRYGIEEPILSFENVLEAAELDLVFVPLVAFDAHMNRMGMGKGYYDRTFHFLKHAPSQKKPVLIGLAYEFQRIEKIEINPWDIPLNHILTDCHTYPLAL